jgi:hypothetical protein
MFTETLKTELSTAENLLERKQRIQDAITAEVANLPCLIEGRLTTEAEYRKLETQRAIGEEAAGLPAARKAAMEATGALAEVSLKLAGMRQTLGMMGSDLAKSYTSLKAEIPAHEGVLAEAFRSEWAAACGVFAVTVERRLALEKLIGPLSLPEPTGAPADLGDMGRPHAHVAALAGAIETISKMKPPTTQFMPGETFIPYDDSKVYVLLRDVEGVREGTKVCDAFFGEGRLEWVVQHGYARPFKATEENAGVSAAARKQKQITDAKAARELSEAEARLHTPPVEVKPAGPPMAVSGFRN